MVTDEIIKLLCAQFGQTGEIEKFEALTDGLVNTTYRVDFVDGSKYLLQKINTVVFTKPAELMENIVNVTSFLRDKIASCGGNPCRETLTFIKGADDKYYHCDADGGYWRMYEYVDNAFTYNSIEKPVIFMDAGRAFGRFQSLLAEYPMDTLHETIPNFHNTAVRFENLVKAVHSNKSGRADNAKNEIEFALNRKDDASRLVSLLNNGKLPVRVTHNDTKLNNVLFDSITGEAFCVIDLDTVMPGLSLYDFGDSIRFGANTTIEDDPDLSKVSVSLELYENYVKGYLTEAAASLCEEEVKQLAFSAKLMTYECGIRFLADYLDGDVYFKTAYPEHNLVRAKNQFALVADIEKHMDELNDITSRAYSEAIAAHTV